MDRSPSMMYLTPIEGPVIDPLTLSQGGRNADKLILGRNQECTLRLPATAEQAWRFHCSFRFENGTWQIADLNSRRGTFLNGVKLSAGQETPLASGDLIRVEPWTFELCSSLNRRGLLADDDRGMTTVHALQPAGDAAGPIDGELLNLLVKASDGIIEQPRPPAANESPTARAQFELTGVHKAIADTQQDGDIVSALFKAVIAHAGRDQLADDATAVLVRWPGSLAVGV